MLEFILIPLTLIALLIASYTDLKVREVPDWLSYGLIFSAFGLRAIFSLEFGWPILISGILGFLPFLLIAYLFYYSDQWGGGDSKLLMGMGAVLGISYPFNIESANLLWYFLLLLFLGALWGVIWMIYEAIRKWEQFINKFKIYLKQYHQIHLILFIITACLLLTTFFLPFFLYIFFFPIAVFYLFIFVNAVEKSCFYHHISPLKLTEGDWLAQKIEVKRKVIIEPRTLEARDIKELQALHQKGFIDNVLIKEGVPFIPGFLLAYLFLLFGKPLFVLLLGVF